MWIPIGGDILDRWPWTRVVEKPRSTKGGHGLWGWEKRRTLENKEKSMETSPRLSPLNYILCGGRKPT